MLPTPSKTPRKRNAGQQIAVSSTARVLFQDRLVKVEDAMPSPRKPRKSKKIAFSLGSFSDQSDGEGSNIPIYTDSKERIPTLEENEDNPFVGSKKVNGPGKTSGKRASRTTRKSEERLAQEAEMDEGARNGDGMIYVL